MNLKNLSLKEGIACCMATICFLSSLVIIFIGLYMHPEGEIHYSLLVFHAMSLSYSGALLGFSIRFDTKHALLNV